MKGDGLFLTLLGIGAVIASLFFDFYAMGIITFNGFNSVKYVFTDFSHYIDILKNIGDVFDISIFLGIFVLYPIVFLLASLISLLKMNGNGSVGGFLFLIHPLAFIIYGLLEFPSNLMDSVEIGLILQLVGGFLIIIGGMKNKE